MASRPGPAPVADPAVSPGADVLAPGLSPRGTRVGAGDAPPRPAPQTRKVPLQPGSERVARLEPPSEPCPDGLPDGGRVLLDVVHETARRDARL